MARVPSRNTSSVVLGLLWSASLAAQSLDPPPVNEIAIAERLVSMTQAQPGERAIIVYDPTYYPGITDRVREALHRRGVFTYVLVDESPSMIATYFENDAAHQRQEQEVIETLLPLFQRSHIFYWMPARGYADDLRWERLVERSQVRSVHFHWLLPFPGSRSAEQIVADSRVEEREALDVDLTAHARRQQQLANALRGRTLRVTTPAGADLRVAVPADQWFHTSDGDASRERAARARSIRDRQIELPVGMFNFVPEPSGVNGTIVSAAIPGAGPDARDVTIVLRAGRVAELRAASGAEAVRRTFADIGPDGDKVATLFLNTNPHSHSPGLLVELGSNWENGGRNNARGASRVGIRLADATIEADGRVIMRDGRVMWDALP